MSQSSHRHVRSLAAPAPLNHQPDRVYANSRVATAETRAIELRLAAGDLALLFIVSCLMLGVAKLMDPTSTLHEGMALSLNVAMGFGLAFGCRYFDLSEGRYSLGKALLIAASLWCLNVLTLGSTASHLSLPLLGMMLPFYGLAALFSGAMHYELGRPFAQNQLYSPYYRLEKGIKRAFDLTSSLLGLIAISPLMLLVPVLLCLESKGSPIFTQTRIGEREVPFKMFKFRSMVQHAAQMPTENKAVLYKRDDDPRITLLGRVIRKLSIDELPQLWNVVRGEMSLVGPRPPLPKEFELMNWYHKRKFEATPGLTGLWQVVGRVKNQRDFNAVAAYDVHYIETWCLMEDLYILLQTIPVVVLQKGAC